MIFNVFSAPFFPNGFDCDDELVPLPPRVFSKKYGTSFLFIFRGFGAYPIGPCILMVESINGSIGLGVRYRYFNNSGGKSLKYLSPVHKCGNGIDDIGKVVSVIETDANVGTGSGNSVSREYELKCGFDPPFEETARLIWPDSTPKTIA